jgi:diketogulonate reductase-like aldo/keto reductase
VFEELVSSGQVLQLGISNIYDLTALQRIYQEASVKPAVVQNRCDD